MGDAVSRVGGAVSEIHQRTDLRPEVQAPQLRLPFPDSVKGFDDLAITDANRTAFSTIRRWKDWHSSVMCLVGPVQCGLGVAARLWADEADARELSSVAFDRLTLRNVEALTERNCVIDLADRITNEDHFLTLLNRMQSKGNHLLLTARTASSTWDCASADLRSRLETLPVAEIYPPDEAMIEARLRSSCKRRYIKLGEATLKFLVIRLPRSYEAIEDYVVRLDKAIDEMGRTPSLPLAKLVLEDGASSRRLFEDD